MVHTRTKNAKTQNQRCSAKFTLQIKLRAGKRSKHEHKSTKNTQENQRRKWREAAQKRRTALKENPQLLAESREKERKRWQRRKEEGKLTAIADLSERQLRCKRKKNRESSQRYRNKKKEAVLKEQHKNSTPSTDEDLQETHENSIPLEVRSKRSNGSTKDVDARRSRGLQTCRHNMKKMNETIRGLQEKLRQSRLREKRTLRRLLRNQSRSRPRDVSG